MKALLLIDIQNDYFPNGKMELVGSESAGLMAGKLLAACRDKKLPVFHIQHFHPARRGIFSAGHDRRGNSSLRETACQRSRDQKKLSEFLSGNDSVAGLTGRVGHRTHHGRYDDPYVR